MIALHWLSQATTWRRTIALLAWNQRTTHGLHGLANEFGSVRECTGVYWVTGRCVHFRTPKHLHIKTSTPMVEAMADKGPESLQSQASQPTTQMNGRMRRMRICTDACLKLEKLQIHFAVLYGCSSCSTMSVEGLHFIDPCPPLPTFAHICLPLPMTVAQHGTSSKEEPVASGSKAHSVRSTVSVNACLQPFSTEPTERNVCESSYRCTQQSLVYWATAHVDKCSCS